jgi:tetratricopeptide (TPR) repeat protein
MEKATNMGRSRGETTRARNTLPFAVAIAAVGLFSFLSGGFVIGRSTPIAVAVLCAAAVWVWFLRRSSRPSLSFLFAIGAFAAFTVWSGLSVLWSVGPDLTWVAFNLTAFYLAVVTVLGLTSVRGLQLRVVAYGSLGVLSAVGVYAFLGKGLPDVVTHAHTYARLDSPVGYWNVLALMMAVAIGVAVSVAGDRHTPAWARSLAAAAAVPVCLAFFFTLSRGGWLVLAIVLVLYFVFTTTRLASLLSLAAITAPLACVLWRLRHLHTLFAETTNDSLRTVQGHTLLRWAVVALAVTVGVQLVAALLQRAVRWPRWSVIAAGAVVLIALGVVVFGGAGTFLQRHGGMQWVRDKAHVLVADQEFGNAGTGAGRLLTVTTNGRITLWREVTQHSPLADMSGTGAGTFTFTHYRFRTDRGVVRHVHSQWLNVLRELGVVGLVVFVAAIVLLLVAAVGNPFARRGDPLHPMLVALQVGAVAFLVHMSWDWDWDVAAAGTLAFVFLATAASYRTTRAADDRRASRRAARAAQDVTDGRDEPAALQAVSTGAERRGELVAAAVTATAVHVSPVPGDEAADEATQETAGPAEAGADDLEARGGEGDEAEAEAEVAPDAVDDYEASEDEAADAPASRRGRHRRKRRPKVGWGVRTAGSILLVLLAVCWLPPYLQQRAENSALVDSSQGRVGPALAHARSAARLDPLAVSPLITEATLLQQLGQSRAALGTLRDAARLQPQNYEVWLALGKLQGSLGRVGQARTSLARALALNPLDDESRNELQWLGN